MVLIRAPAITLHHTATYCSTLQHTHTPPGAGVLALQHPATHYNTLQQTTKQRQHTHTSGSCCTCSATPCNTLQHTATHCNTLQHTATHCDSHTPPGIGVPALQHTATPCNTLRHPATPCNTLQHTTTHCNHCTTLQHTTAHTHLYELVYLLCNTLQHAATHCNTHTPPGVAALVLPPCALSGTHPSRAPAIFFFPSRRGLVRRRSPFDTVDKR